MSELVWVVQVSDYDDQSVVAVGRSLEHAVEALRAEYQSPYVVEWEDVVPGVDGDYWTISAALEHVPSFSTKHVATWTIGRHEVV